MKLQNAWWFAPMFGTVLAFLLVAVSYLVAAAISENPMEVLTSVNTGALGFLLARTSLRD